VLERERQRPNSAASVVIMTAWGMSMIHRTAAAGNPPRFYPSGKCSREAARATTSVRAVENLMLRAEAQLATAERAVASAASAEAKEQAENAKAKAAARTAEIEAQLSAAKEGLQTKLDAAAAAREAAVAADTAKAVAAEEAEMARALEPVSVFISRKTQRLYVRQAFQPILETPVHDPGCRSSDRHAYLHRR
jgi:hypothetical protein